MIILLLATLALAERPNKEPTITIALTHHAEPGHRWGVDVGGAWLFTIGDHCTWSETDCRTGHWWPVTGPRAALSWRGGDRFGAAFEVDVGVGWMEMYHFGFFPIAAAYGAVGFAVEVGAPGALTFGGTLTKSLSYRKGWPIPGGTAYRVHGLDPLSLTVGARGRWAESLLPPKWSLGLEMATVAGSYY